MGDAERIRAIIRANHIGLIAIVDALKQGGQIDLEALTSTMTVAIRFAGEKNEHLTVEELKELLEAFQRPAPATRRGKPGEHLRVIAETDQTDDQEQP